MSRSFSFYRAFFPHWTPYPRIRTFNSLSSTHPSLLLPSWPSWLLQVLLPPREVITLRRHPTQSQHHLRVLPAACHLVWSLNNQSSKGGRQPGKLQFMTMSIRAIFAAGEIACSDCRCGQAGKNFFKHRIV